MTHYDNKPSLAELTHHGVKGMHWGIRKEYVAHPVATVRNARASINKKRIAKFESNAAVMNTQISDIQAANKKLEGSRNPINAYLRANNRSAIQQLSKARDRNLKDAEAVRNGKLTSTQKKVIIGAAAVGVILLGAAAAQGHESGALNSMQLRGQAFLKGQATPFKLNKELAGRKSPEEILKHVSAQVNPNYRSPGGQMNCRRSTFTHELRRRGYDVQATTARSGTGQSESGFINAVTPGAKKFISSLSVTQSIAANPSSPKTSPAARDKRSNPIQKTTLKDLKVSLEDQLHQGIASKSSSKAVYKELEKQPEGARGEVLFNFGSFGHSMAYEIIGGKAHIFDSQKAKLYTEDKPVETKWDGFHAAEITRLDNVDLDLSFLSRWSTNRRG